MNRMRGWLQAATITVLAALLAGCGGGPPAQPTAIPASIVRPVQPTPQYSSDSGVFALLTPNAAPQFIATAAAGAPFAIADAAASGERAAIKLFLENQTPSAVGISLGGTAIYAARGGQVLAAVPAGGIVTVTGKSADGAWYSVYDDAAVFGWTPAGQLRVYGGDDLVVVEQAPDPAPVATLLAQAAVPLRVLDDLMAQMEITPEAAPAPAAPSALSDAPLASQLAEPTPSGDVVPLTGVVTSEGRLNLRMEPDTQATIVRKLDPGTVVNIVARSTDATWLRLELDDGVTGWVAAEFVTLDR